jgi:hypothetical protein
MNEPRAWAYFIGDQAIASRGLCQAGADETGFLAAVACHDFESIGVELDGAAGRHDGFAGLSASHLKGVGRYPGDGAPVDPAEEFSEFTLA